MRILYAGSPGIAVPSLEALDALGCKNSVFQLVGVLTNPDAPRGRKGALIPTEVGAAAEAINILRSTRNEKTLEILKFESLKTEARKAVEAFQPDLLISFAYGHIFGPKFLGLFPLGGINIHPSVLPKYRGASPIPAAILNRDTHTGISIQRLAAQMDSGAILMQESIALEGRETTASLSDRVALLSAELLVRVLEDLAAGTQIEKPQDHDQASYCSPINKEDGRIDWSKGLLTIDAHIRAYTPWPLSYTFHKGQVLYILEAHPYEGPAPSGCAQAGSVLGIDKQAGILVQTGEGILALRRLQYGTKKALGWKDFLNGARDFIGSRLG